jgi:hypothetical protein
MTALRNPDTGSVIQATGRLETRLIEQGWYPTNDPPSPGLRLLTAADLDAAVATSEADRTDLRSILEPLAAELPQVASEVDELTATVEATTTAQAPKPTPRTDALEAWRTEAEPVIDGLHPVATSGSYTDLTNRPTLGTMAAQGKSTVDITGGTITGITDLAVGDGGTGASIPADARANLGL